MRDGGREGGEGGDELLRYRGVRSRRGVVNRNRTSENRHLQVVVVVVAAVATVVIRWWMLRRRLATICANVTVASLLLETDELCCIRELVAASRGDSAGFPTTVYNIHAGRKTYFQSIA